ncbi:MAG: glycosyltransferase family 2 protein [Ignisphaera sp.]
MFSLVWSLPTTIIVLSFLYGLTTVYSAIKDLKKTTWIDIEVNDDVSNTPHVAIVIPLYREDKESIEETFRSILNQRYPLNKITVYVILENGDDQTKNYVDEIYRVFTEMGIAIHIHINDGNRVGKAKAMNGVLNKIIDEKHSVVIVLDAGDRISDSYYIYKCIELLKRGYKIVGTKVYRVGNGIIAKLSYIDTILWYNISFPGIHSITKVPFLSGEGLAISMDFLKDVGGFPEVLAEDAYIAMLSFIKSEKVAFLNSVVLEGAPSTLGSLVKQRLRWYRGGIECLKEFVLKYYKNVNKGKAVAIIIAYLQIVALTAPFISLIVILMSVFVKVPYPVQLLAKIELISLLVSPIFLYITNKVKDPVIFLAPFSWILQSILALVSLLPVKISWLKTSARSKVYVNSMDYSTKPVRL